MTDLSGKSLGQYRLIECVSQGAVAAVYKTYQPALERAVALKIIPFRSPAEAELFYRRNLSALEATALLTHPHILSPFDFGSEAGLVYIAMAYLPGVTLAARLAELAAAQASLPLAEAGRIGQAIADAVAYAHRQEVIHGNLQPANIVLTDQGGLVVTDFGLANLLPVGPAITSRATAYLAPEQAAGQPAGRCSDIYALGVLLYELVTGRLPDQAEPTPPGRLNPALPPALEQLIGRAMSASPNDRYQDAAELATALAAALPAKAPRLLLEQGHVDFWVEGQVTALLERGFSLATGPGLTLSVSTLSRGDQLGLRPGDRVKAFGGFAPDTGRFLSGAIWQVRPDGTEIRIRDEPARPGSAAGN
jgi:serine/threonine protein kinase